MDKWDKRFMEAARLVSTWSSCYQENRQVGAVIAKNKRILTTGYNGASSGIKNCKERGECLRRKLGIASGTQNAIIQAARLGVSIEGATLYCTHQPCVICAKMIINSGISRVVYAQGYPDKFAMELFSEAGVECTLFEE